jgi:hypothetical protein
VNIKYLDTLVKPDGYERIIWDKFYRDVEREVLFPSQNRVKIIESTRDRLIEEGFITEVGCDRFEVRKDIKAEIFDAVVYVYSCRYRPSSLTYVSNPWEVN